MKILEIFIKTPALLMMTTLLAAPITAAPAAPAPEAPRTVEIDLMKMERDARCGHILVTGLVGGEPMRLLLDTGATHTVLHTESAARLKNVRWLDTSLMTFLSNSQQVPKMLLAPLMVGPGQSDVHPIVVMDLSAVRNMLAEKVDGIVGMDFLGALPFTFDFRRNEYYWGLPSGVSLVPLQVEMEGGRRVFLNLSCAGKPLRLLLDTGSAITRVPSESWAPGVGAEITAQIGNVDSASHRTLIEGKAGDIDVAPGVKLQGVVPLLGEMDEPAILGLDALKNSVLIHMPAEHEGGVFFMCP